MQDPNVTLPPKSVTSVWPALALLLLAIVVFFIARGYAPNSARLPVMVSGAMIVLTLLDLWSRTGLPGARLVETMGGTSFKMREMMHNPRVADQVICVGWIAIAFALMAVCGILAASVIFCSAFMRFRGQLSLVLSAAVGVGVLVFLFVVFEWALDYELYRGLLFTEGGVSAW